jgi:anti-anti-sigma regulatory factor
MHDLHLKTQQTHGVEVIQLKGALEPTNFTGLADTLSRLIERVTPCIVLDCRNLNHIATPQLKELANFASYARTRGGDIKCVGLCPTIQYVADLVASGDPIECYGELAVALAAFRSPLPPPLRRF